MSNGIFIGRFQPAHKGHIQVLADAASRVDKLLILIGSANQCRSIKNPWTYKERRNYLFTKLREAKVENYEIKPLNDYKYADSQWITDVRITAEDTFYQKTAPIMFGHMKEGNNYLTWFPDWKFENVNSEYTINATQVRARMFAENNSDMPQSVRDDKAFYDKEAQLFANYPFPETLNFNCGDAILECQGHILLILRKRAPGAGTWALPGGFRDRRDKTLVDCALRELEEETNVRVPSKVLRGSIVKTELFDDIGRSFGIPRNTMAVYMRVNPNPDGTLPRANGADDAVEAKWVTLTDALNKYDLYDDHKDIISKMTGVMPLPAFVNIK
jgi:bifunctional NMN adenylyltransferase/nudix hydrolase